MDQTSRHQAKIDPSRRAPSAPAHPAGEEGPIGPANPALDEWQAAGLAAPDLNVIRRYRLERLRQELAARDVAGCLLYDPLNIRYATDSSNMQVWTMHNAVRYAFLATDGPLVLFDFHGCGHLTDHLALIDEVRGARSWITFEAGGRVEEIAKLWADELADLVIRHGGGNRRLLCDKIEPQGAHYLQARGVEVIAGMEFAEEARKIKHPEEIKAMARAIHASEVGMWQMWRKLRPGITENQLWSELHQANIARGGEWIETRLLASGPRTNPWFSECSDRPIEAGDIVAFDTDLIGPYGYCSDISRTWVCAAAPSAEQRALHALAQEQIAFNLDCFEVGGSFFDFCQRAFKLPAPYVKGRYGVMLHGVGLCDEYPSIRYPQDIPACGYDGQFLPGMVLCFESYIGAEGGREGVKLERQALVTERGLELLDRFPMDLIPD